MCSVHKHVEGALFIIYTGGGGGRGVTTLKDLNS